MTDGATNPDADWHCRATVELLISEGADVSARDVLKQTALHHAAIRGNEQVIQVLCNAAKPNITDVSFSPNLFFNHSPREGVEFVFDIRGFQTYDVSFQDLDIFISSDLQKLQS